MIIYLAGGMRDGWQDRVRPLLGSNVVLDLQGVREADVVLVHMSSSNPSGFGLSVELGYAYALGKRIVFCDEIASDWRTGYFGMHREMATVVCRSLEEAAKAIYA